MTKYPPSLPTATYSVSCQVLCIGKEVVQRPGECETVLRSLSKEVPASISCVDNEACDVCRQYRGRIHRSQLAPQTLEPAAPA